MTRALDHLRFPAISTETTRPYTAMIPDMTTGIRDYTRTATRCEKTNSVDGTGRIGWSTFMMSSGLNCPTPAIPIPAFAVPNAAPTARNDVGSVNLTRSVSLLHTHCSISSRKSIGERPIGYPRKCLMLTAEATPANPKNGA